MSDERTQKRLAESCNKLSEVSTDLPNVSVWLESGDVEKCNNLIANNTEELCEFEKNTFGLDRRDNKREFKKIKLDLQKQYNSHLKEIIDFENLLLKLINEETNTDSSLLRLKKYELKSLYQSSYEFINSINRKSLALKNKIVKAYPMVEGSQYKDLLIFYKKIKDNMEALEKIKDSISYIQKRLENKTDRLNTIEKVNFDLKITIGVFFVIGIILALLYRFL